MPKKNSWISRNPIKTGIFIFIIITLLLLVVTDIILGKIKPIKHNREPEIVRAINLREHHPGLEKIINPSEHYLSETDNLIDQDYLFRIDENGFLLPHNTHIDPDYKIVFIGGSTTECMYVLENNRFPYLSGNLLEEKTGFKINSYNSGAAGNTSIHSLEILLNKIIPMNPDIVMIKHAINDYSILAYDHTYWPVETTRSGLITINDYFPKRPKETLWWHFKGLIRMTIPNIYQRLNLIKESLNQQTTASEPFDEWSGRRHMIKDRDFEFMKKEYKWALQMLVTTCKSRDIVPVLLTQANRIKDNPDTVVLKSLEKTLKNGISYDTFKYEYDTFNQVVRDVAKSNGIPLIDLANLVPQDKKYMYDIMHYNDTGSIFTAEIISDQLIPVLNAIEK